MSRAGPSVKDSVEESIRVVNLTTCGGIQKTDCDG